MNAATQSFPWITRDFIRKIIESFVNGEHVEIESFEAASAFTDGENFSGLMIRLKVMYKHQKSIKQAKFIIKKAHDSSEFEGIYEESASFEKEIEVYTKILPKVESLLEAIGQHCQIAPRCYLGDLKRRIIVFEDLSVQQFVNVDKANGLDIDHMKCILITLAKWHAATAMLLLNQPELFVEHKRRKWYENVVIVRKFFKGIAKTVSNAARNWEGYERIADKIANVPEHAYDNVYKAYLPTDGAFNTLVHGDMWSSNIMFCHDQNGKPCDIRFVDFALGKHTNPSIDLVCLLYGCSHQSLRQKDREELIQFYHGELVNLLQLFGYPNQLPRLLEIQTATFRIDLYNALIVLFVIGLRYVGKSGEFLELVGDCESDQMFTHPECITKLKYMLDLFDRRGYFEFYWNS